MIEEIPNPRSEGPKVMVYCVGIGTFTASAFNAIVSSSVVALDLSYAMPIAVNCLRGRKLLPPRAWQLPSGMGWLADMVSYRVTCYVVQSASAYERNAAWLVVYCSDNGAVSVSTWAAGHWE
ncbi:uncharacterized protein ACHE_50043A [Aspergillus chevalieri]|uniref:Uncharacterized protein n=1 Tax=Aspergillus chevalieri TaxID=182096 RepID=A0A7R7VQ92_ASPCH|nr:uncharacterized protein ACHE_50043A [Aspergillus chevalieri]BCR88845.1 hypothetical protein ACHE_50043A [Aspergillus chevalieri]